MLIVNNKLKNLIRDFIPMKYQVPIKYYYNWVNATLEPEMKILEYLVKKNDHVIDVGGNRGIYAYKFWMLGAKVEIFEPNTNCSSVLSAWAVDKNNINVYSIALSNRMGSSYLHVPVDEAGIEHDASGSIESDRFVSARDHKVKLEELDNYHFENIKLIKIDVEGHEYSAIEGATKTIQSMQPSLLIEIEQRHNDKPILNVFNKILSFGYEGYFLNNGKLKSLSEFELTRDQNPENRVSSRQKYINNFIFLHKDKINDFKMVGLLN